MSHILIEIFKLYYSIDEIFTIEKINHKCKQMEILINICQFNWKKYKQIIHKILYIDFRLIYLVFFQK